MTSYRVLTRGKVLLSNITLLLLVGAKCWAQVPQEPPALQNTADTSPSATPAASQTASARAAERTEPAAAVSDFPVLRAVGGLGLILSLVLLGYFAVRRLAPQYFAGRSSEKNLKLIETLSMGEKRSIAVVEFDAKRFLIGNTQHQITLLAALPERHALVSELPLDPIPDDGSSRTNGASDSFRNLYEVERSTAGRPTARPIPPDIRAKMRQLRDALER